MSMIIIISFTVGTLLQSFLKHTYKYAHVLTTSEDIFLSDGFLNYNFLS